MSKKKNLIYIKNIHNQNENIREKGFAFVFLEKKVVMRIYDDK